MTKTIGAILSIGGLITLYTGINYLNKSESFGFLGADGVVSKAILSPKFLSALVMILGIFLMRTK